MQSSIVPAVNYVMLASCHNRQPITDQEILAMVGMYQSIHHSTGSGKIEVHNDTKNILVRISEFATLKGVAKEFKLPLPQILTGSPHLHGEDVQMKVYLDTNLLSFIAEPDIFNVGCEPAWDWWIGCGTSASRAIHNYPSSEIPEWGREFCRVQGIDVGWNDILDMVRTTPSLYIPEGDEMSIIFPSDHGFFLMDVIARPEGTRVRISESSALECSLTYRFASEERAKRARLELEIFDTCEVDSNFAFSIHRVDNDNHGIKWLCDPMGRVICDLQLLPMFVGNSTPMSFGVAMDYHPIERISEFYVWLSSVACCPTVPNLTPCILGPAQVNFASNVDYTGYQFDRFFLFSASKMFDVGNPHCLEYAFLHLDMVTLGVVFSAFPHYIKALVNDRSMWEKICQSCTV